MAFGHDEYILLFQRSQKAGTQIKSKTMRKNVSGMDTLGSRKNWLNSKSRYLVAHSTKKRNDIDPIAASEALATSNIFFTSFLYLRPIGPSGGSVA